MSKIAYLQLATNPVLPGVPVPDTETAPVIIKQAQTTQSVVFSPDDDYVF